MAPALVVSLDDVMMANPTNDPDPLPCSPVSVNCAFGQARPSSSQPGSLTS